MLPAIILVECLVCCRETRQWLMLHRAEAPRVWSTMTGGVEEGELCWEAALRELRVETGIDPGMFFNTNFSSRFYRHDPEQLYEIFTLLAVLAEKQDVVLDSEHDDYAWLAIEEACERIVFVKQREGLLHAA